MTARQTRLAKANADVKRLDEEAGRVLLSYFVDVVLPRLGLTQWTIWLDAETPPINGALAEIASDPDNHYAARIRFSWDLMRATPERRRVALVHEGLHLRFFPATDYIEETVAAMNTTAVYELWQIGFTQLVEREVDGLAEALATSFPLPDDDYIRVGEAGPEALSSGDPQARPAPTNAG